MEEMLARFWNDLMARPDGPLAVRFYLQPAMAIFFAVKDGIRDARHRKPPYLLAIFTHPEQRRELISAGWRSIAKIAILALILDATYQLLVLKIFYPGEAIIIAIALAILPYALFRGSVNRMMRHHTS